MSERSLPRFLVVEGPIGVGKTSLVRRLSESFGSDMLLEQAEENPFLERFYRDARTAAFPTQLFFLFQRSRQLEELTQQDLFRSALVADFMLEKDRLFAELTLDRHELDLYLQVYRRLVLEAPAPDLVVYLRAPVDTLMQRIRRRGRKEEKGMEPAYLHRLSEAYDAFFASYERSPLLIINASEINPVDSEADYQLLLDKICTVKAGRHFFNPGPSLL